MWEFIKRECAYLHGTFHDSEVILWSRLNVALGSAWYALQGVDVSPILKDPHYLVLWIIFSNFINEMLRRRRGDYDEDGKLR